MTRGEELHIDADHGDPEDLRSLMLEFRKFVSQRDDAHFYSICGIIERRVTDPVTIGYSRTNRIGWHDTMTGAGDGRLQLQHGKRKVSGVDLLNVWMNGVLFHSDPDDEALYESLEPMGRAWFQQEVNRMVIEGLRVVHAQRNVINDVLARGLLT
jgi:hypothetical protein